MKQILQRYLCLVMGIAIIVMLFFNYILTGEAIRKETKMKFQYALDQIEQTLQKNHQELQEIKTELYKEYITKTTALAYIIHDKPSILENQYELEQMRQLLDVDEVCITDAQGIIQYSSDPSYIGIDFSAHEQTRFFLPILENSDLKLVQEIEKNAANNEEFQYAGVSRIGEAGIVQIGMKPVRLKEAQERCTYPYLFSRIPVGLGENIFAVNQKTGEILAYSQDNLVGKNLSELHEEKQKLSSYDNGGFLYLDGKEYYTVTRIIEGVIVGFSISKDILYENRLSQTMWTGLYLTVSGLIVIFVLNRLLSIKIIDSIYRINQSLAEIEKGDLSLTIKENSTPEFQKLSTGINQMVASLMGIGGKLSRIISTTGINFAAFEYDKITKCLMITDHLQSILALKEEDFNCLKENGDLFLEYLEEIMSHPLEGDIYSLNYEEEHWVRIVLSTTKESVAGTITDVSEDVKKHLHIQFERDHDALTGLNNYRSFQEQVSSILISTEQKGISAGVMIDLDNFKSINDTWGHDFGDTYLQRMAKVLRSLEKYGIITARRAGDEFCIFFYNWKSKDEVRQEMQELRGLLEQYLLVFPDGKKRMIYASFGLAWAEPKEISFENLMYNADNALYHAKKDKTYDYIEFKKKFDNNNYNEK